jgi:hypothetical protein
MAQRRIAEAPPADEVLKHLDCAIAFAKTNQLIYQRNYDDDYDATDGLCAKVTEKLEAQRAKPTSAEAPVLIIPWEKQADIVPAADPKADCFLRGAIGFTPDEDYYRLGVVFTVQSQQRGGEWKTIFRKSVHRRSQGWHEFEIPLDQPARLRFLTDSYSRAMDRTAPTWKWALWRRPQLVRGAQVIDDFGERISQSRAFVRLDGDGKDRAFDRGREDSSGATFSLQSAEPVIAAFTPHKDGKFGVTVAEYDVSI